MATKLSSAQLRVLQEQVTDDWTDVPSFCDRRPFRPLIRAKMVEVKTETVSQIGIGIRGVRNLWRRTDAGRAALSPSPPQVR